MQKITLSMLADFTDFTQFLTFPDSRYILNTSMNRPAPHIERIERVDHLAHDEES